MRFLAETAADAQAVFREFFGAITLESDEPLGRQIVTMLDVALRGVGDRWNDIVLPDDQGVGHASSSCRSSDAELRQ